jgi:hypothetical protein
VTVPSSWQRLGNVFDDLGFVVAEPHPGTDTATWPQLTIAALDVPVAKGTNTPPSLDTLIDLMLTPDGSFTSAETLQRSRLLLNGAEAETIRVRLHENGKDAGTIEELALIQAEPGTVYSIALRCAAEDFERLDGVFQSTARSWRIQPRMTQPANHSAPSSKTQEPEKR